MPSRTLLALALATAPLAAQFDFDLEKRSPATLGSTLDLDVVGAPPGSLLMIVPSTTFGPTPLSLIDPADPRALSIGSELFSLMSFAIADANGAASYSVSLPGDPAVSGFELHWQSVRLVMNATFFGAMSNDVVALTGAAETGQPAADALQIARSWPVTILDTDNNNSQGDVLVVGGGAGPLLNATGLSSTEQWDFRRMRFSAGPDMSEARALHAAVTLDDGRTLIVGGVDGNGAGVVACQIYDPATNSFSSTGALHSPRVLFGVTKLADGRVMVAGGTATLANGLAATIGSVQSTVEIWNPSTNSWAYATALGDRLLAPALSLLNNGDVLVSGGVKVTLIGPVPTGATSVTTVKRWNAATGNWVNGPNMAQARAGHQFNQVTLPDGRLLMTGGMAVASLINATNAPVIGGAEIYDPVSNSWQTINMPTPRALHSATVLADGRVAVCGGAQGTLAAAVPIASVDVFDPVTNTWSSAPDLSGPRGGHSAQLLPDGTLALFGGTAATQSLSTVETLRF